MKLIVQLKGVDTLSLRTKALVAAAQRGAKFGVSEAGQLLVDEAKMLVPVDTGRLRDSIHAELLEATDTRTVVAVTPAYEEPNEYGFAPEYARAVEYGFTALNKAGRNQHTPAQPYMRPSFDGKKGECEQTIKDSIYAELDAVKR